MSCSDILSTLPNEILSTIFLKLPTSDRNRVRLTCRRFYEACDTLDIHRKEALVFRGTVNTVHSVAWYVNIKRKSWNIKLCNISLDGYSVLTFFQKHGPNIHSITIDNCKMAYDILRNVIKWCENLNSIALIFDDVDNSMIDIVFEDLKNLQKDNIIRVNVTNFTLKHYSEKDDWRRPPGLTNRRFLRFFAVFPNIRALKVDLLLEYDIFNTFWTISTDTDVNSESDLTFSCIYYQLSLMAHQLENLTLLFEFDILEHISNLQLPFSALNKLAQIEMKNLKTLSLSFFDFWDLSGINPLLPLKHLTHVTWYIRFDVASTTISTFLQILLSSMTELRSLCLGHSNNFSMTRDCFRRLVRSQLITLIVNKGKLSIDFEPESLGSDLLPNYILKDLNLASATGTVFSLFSQYFHGLKKFIVDIIQESTLQNVFKYEKELQYLELYNKCGHFSKFKSSLEEWLRNENILYIRQFDNLTHLHIKDQESFHLSELLLGQFAFPSLKSLKVDLMISTEVALNNNIDPSWKAIQKLTQLEYLEIKVQSVANDILYNHILAMCSSLPLLRYFIIFIITPAHFDDLKYHKLFELCLSLRVIACEVWSTSWASYYNPIEFYFKDLITDTVIPVHNFSMFRVAGRSFKEDMFPKYRLNYE